MSLDWGLEVGIGQTVVKKNDIVLPSLIYSKEKGNQEESKPIKIEFQTDKCKVNYQSGSSDKEQHKEAIL